VSEVNRSLTCRWGSRRVYRRTLDKGRESSNITERWKRKSLAEDVSDEGESVEVWAMIRSIWLMAAIKNCS